MKFKKLLLGLSLFGFFFVCHSGLAGTLDNWHWRNPVPNGNPPVLPHSLHGLVFTNGNFFGVGDSGVVSISSDATNWIERPTATSNQLNAIIYGNGLFLAVGN